MEYSLIGFIISFIIGAIPTSFIIGKWIGKLDIRQHGSGNVGATNVNRTMGAKWGLFVLAFDVGKGVAAVLAMPLLFQHSDMHITELRALYGFAAITGHIWSPFLKFKGGKGVATSLGVFICLSAPSTLIATLAFVLVVWKTRYISLGSLIAAIAVPVSMAIFHEPRIYLMLSMVISVIIVQKHKSNLKRVAMGEENTFSFKKTPKVSLDPKNMEIVLDILKKHIPQYEVRAFGSRITQQYKKFSDLDIAILAPSELNIRELGDIKDAFSESNLPIKVDVLDWHNISEDFQNLINQNFIVIQKGS